MINLYNVNNHNQEGNGAVTPPAPVSKGSFEKYSDPTGEVTGKGLKWGIWYVGHKVLLYKILIWILASVGAVLWLFSLWQWGSYLIFGLTNDAKIYAELAVFRDYTAINERFAAGPLQILNTGLYQSGVNKYDAVAEVANPSGRFVVWFDYYFDFGSFQTPRIRGFILPGETRPIVYSGVEEGGGGNPSVVLDNINWQRISNHEISDVAAWKAERLNFVVSDFDISRAGTGDGANAHIISFNLANSSPFGYKEPFFYVELLEGDTPVAILPLHLENFKSLETRPIDLRSFVSSLSASDVRLYPVIDILDKSVYMEPVTE